MKLVYLKMTFKIILITFTTFTYAKNCQPPSSGVVQFTFQVDGVSCSIDKRVANEVGAGQYDYSSSGQTEDGKYYRARYGCDDNGNWGVLAEGLTCEPIKHCAEASELSLEIFDRSKKKCNITFSPLPRTESGSTINNGVAQLKCFHGILSADKNFNFNCPAELVIPDETTVDHTSSTPLTSNENCQPPESGVVTFNFRSNGHSCSIDKRIAGPIRAGGFDYSSSGLTADGKYYRVRYGCDRNGNWGVLSEGLKCEPAKDCEAESNLTLTALDKDRKNCRLDFSTIPELGSGDTINNGVGKVKCFHGELSVDKRFEFSCPDNLVVANDFTPDNESNREPASDNPVTTMPVPERPITTMPVPENPISEKPLMFDEVEAKNNQIAATSAALGVGMLSKCNAGPKAKSFDNITNGFSKYHSVVLANVKEHKTGIARMNARSEALTEEANSDQSVSQQLESLQFQIDSTQLMIDLYNKSDSGIYREKVKLLDMISAGLIVTTQENEEYTKLSNDCRKHASLAVDLANVGCSRTKIVETCDEDGSNCEETTESDPVEGACLASEMIPHSVKLTEDLFKLDTKVMPSNLLTTSRHNILQNYLRYVSFSLPKGEWQTPLNSCGKLLFKASDYGVRCTTPQGDITHSAKWNVPIEGTTISDLYQGVLGRLPDNGGHYYWQNEHKRLIEEGMTKDEATAQIRFHISESNENKGIEDTEEEKQKRNEYYIKNNVERRRCEDVRCGLADVPKSSFDADKWYSSIESQARFRFLVKPEEEESAVNKLKVDSFKKFENADLLIGSISGRKELINQMKQFISLAKEEDETVMRTLQRRKAELVEMLNNLRTTSSGQQNEGGY